MLRRHFLWYLLLFASGCTAATNNQRSNNNSLLKEKEKLLFAVSDALGIKELQRDYEPFRTVLEQVLETKIEFFPVDNFVEVATALQLGLVDLVLAGPSEYVIIKARTNAVPIVALTRPNYLAAIAVRQDSDLKSLADLKGKTLELGKVGITGSYLGQIKMLMDAGLNPKSDVKILSSDDYRLKGLKNGEVDAWGRTLHRYESSLKNEGASEKDYPLLAKGKPLPNDVFIASSKLEPMLVDEIGRRMLENQEKLLQAILSVPAFASKFKDATLAPANDSDYDMIREVYKAIGEDDFLK
ncbi:phosphonate ABC transporter substrate-binding protein [Hydrocoleum sp. CS-953]|uniref:phosphate/phosphite/phosphonate ABC transporter substrate-binding protein n=1 Tax=Hydrocoleum sp. CS-953 TaxID=1671698 RepID=UPI000B9B6E56|nr:PhnD/SsuA/transferrin family substrate-binding protein [Hydrocoleum sp. CS-953]OZH55369.1 phosphonate ABC transporter substrate-binding protein [Hydrocoleum sp. CS-953]